MILEIKNGPAIDLTKVEYVSKLHGDSHWRRYNVELTSGGTILIYQDREGEIVMKREKFIKEWKKTLGV